MQLHINALSFPDDEMMSALQWSMHQVAGTAALCESRDSDGKWDDTSTDHNHYAFGKILFLFAFLLFAQTVVLMGLFTYYVRRRRGGGAYECW